ncbi:MAG: hypothetical protein ACQETI_12450 [Halobacteriota archaeon]
MSRTETPLDAPTSDDFEAALTTLVATAQRANVDLEQAWDVADDAADGYVMVELTRVEPGH